MNSLIFLLPFLAILSVGLITDHNAVQEAEAQTPPGLPTNGQTVHGYDYSITDNQDGSYTWGSHEPYVWNGSEYVPFIVMGNSTLTAAGNVNLDNDGRFNWEDRIYDDIRVKYTTDGGATWTYANSLNDLVPDRSALAGTSKSERLLPGTGLLEYKYILQDGKWKTQMEFTKLGGPPNRTYAFEQMLDIDVDTIQIGTVTVNIDQNSGTVYDKTFLEANEGQIIDFLNGVIFNLDIGFADLNSIQVIDTGVNSSQLIFEYVDDAPLSNNEMFVVDPTFSYTVGTFAVTKNSPATGSSCVSTGWTDAAADIFSHTLGASGSAQVCRASSFEWDISSITDGSTITNVQIRYDVVTSVSMVDCDFVSIQTQPVAGTQAHYEEAAGIAGGSTAFVSNDTDCATVANDYVLDLGSAADADLQANLGVDWWAVGTHQSSYPTRDATLRYGTINQVELEVTYTLPTPLTHAPGHGVTLTVNDGNHLLTTGLNLEWTNSTLPDWNGFRIFRETPIGGGFITSTANTSNTNLYFNDTGLTAGTFYNYKVAATNGTHIGDNSSAFAYSPHRVPEAVEDLAVATNDSLQFLLSWTQPSNLYGTLLGYMINYTTPAGDPTTVYVNHTGTPDTSATVDGLDPTTEHSFRVSPVTVHGSNSSGNIENATLTLAVEVGNLNFTTSNNPDTEPIWFELFNIDNSTDVVQVRFNSALTVDCTIDHRIAGTSANYTSLSETPATGYVYHNFTVTNAGNDILDWDCYDQTDNTIDGQYSLIQSESATGVGGPGNVPLFAMMNNFTDGLYGTEGDFAGIDLITLFIVIVSMLGFNRKHPALGIGIMSTMLGAAWYFEVIPWTSGVLGGIAMVLVLAIGQGLKKD